MLLSILIPTIAGREKSCNSLIKEIKAQCPPVCWNIEILTCKDNKEMSIGVKRQHLLDSAKGEYCVMVDDDDMIHHEYINRVLQALQSKPDCVGYLERVLLDGKKQIACHSDRWKEWKTKHEGYDYVRTIFYKDVIRTSIAKQIGFKDLRYGEDHDFSVRLKQSGLLKTEVFINEIMYYYTYNSISPKEHAERYGIK